jgi:hypothetical protein
MSFFCLSIEDIAACSMNFISTCPCFKSSGLRSATVAYWINENEVWRNENEEKDGPFLLISYTNHALDQFLLEITKRVPGLKEKDVVRLGSRSEVEEEVPVLKRVYFSLQ